MDHYQACHPDRPMPLWLKVWLTSVLSIMAVLVIIVILSLMDEFTFPILDLPYQLWSLLRSTPDLVIEQEHGNMQALPAELGLEIFDYLGCQDHIRLSQVNRHFHALGQPQNCSKGAKTDFLLIAETWRKHCRQRYFDKVGALVRQELESYACFTCFRIRPANFFEMSQTREPFSKSRTVVRDLHQRCCIDCAFAKGSYEVGTFFICQFKPLVFVWDDNGVPSPKAAHHSVICSTCRKISCCELVSPSAICSKCLRRGLAGGEMELQVRDNPLPRGIIRVRCLPCRHVQLAGWLQHFCNICSARVDRERSWEKALWPDKHPNLKVE